MHLSFAVYDTENHLKKKKLKKKNKIKWNESKRTLYTKLYHIARKKICSATFLCTKIHFTAVFCIIINIICDTTANFFSPYFHPHFCFKYVAPVALLV